MDLTSTVCVLWSTKPGLSICFVCILCFISYLQVNLLRSLGQRCHTEQHLGPSSLSQGVPKEGTSVAQGWRCCWVRLPARLHFQFSSSSFPLFSLFPFLSHPVPFTLSVFQAFSCYWAFQLHPPPSWFAVSLLSPLLSLFGTLRCCLASFLNLFTLTRLKASYATGQHKLCITQIAVLPNLY